MSNSVRDTINYLNTEKQKAIIEYQKKIKRTNDYYNKIMRQLNEAKRKDPEIKEYLDTPIPEPIVKQLLSIQRNNKTESDNR
jgi:phosphate uptake regulator